MYAGTRIHPIAHVVNDADDATPLKGARLAYELVASNGRRELSEEFKLPEVPYYQTWSRKLEITLPTKLATGDYQLTGKITHNGRVISHNEEPIFIAGADWLPTTGTPTITKAARQPNPSVRFALYDPAGKTSAALRKLGVAFDELSTLSALNSSHGCLVLERIPGIWLVQFRAPVAGIHRWWRAYPLPAAGPRFLCDRLVAGANHLLRSLRQCSHLPARQPAFQWQYEY